MNEQTTTERKPTIEAIECGSNHGEMIINLINLLGKVVNPLRVVPGVIDTEIITAAVTYAGCVHGELIALGMMDADTAEGEEQVKLLLHNYAAGVGAGIHKVEQIKAAKAEKGGDA